MKISYGIKALLVGGSLFATSLFASAQMKYSEMPSVTAADYSANIDPANDREATSERIVGDCFLIGAGVDQDFKKAWKWYSQAITDGDNVARYRIACMYDEGYGVTQNDKEAAYWYGRAAKSGHPLAMLRVADCYYEGRGLIGDKRIAAENYWRAADRGVAEAAYKLALMLSEGEGFPTDKSMALKYFNQAAADNYSAAADMAAELVAQGVKLPGKRTGVVSASQKKTGKPQGAKTAARKNKRK